MTGDFSEADLREAALRLLARREHSRAELTVKLTRRGWPGEDVAAVIDQLAGEGLQSDERYAESCARQRAGKCYGPIRIRAELNERGIDRSLIDQTLRELDVDWPERAAHWYGQRYRNPPQDFREKARRQQALARRGFAHEHIRDLLG